MLEWLKRKLTKDEYLQWQEFSHRLDNMALSEFKKKVDEHNEEHAELES